MKKHVRTNTIEENVDHYRLARIEDKMLTMIAFQEIDREREREREAGRRAGRRL
jgi:hypothetical protein